MIPDPDSPSFATVVLAIAAVAVLVWACIWAVEPIAEPSVETLPAPAYVVETLPLP